jgi:hypothetical protein
MHRIAPNAVAQDQAKTAAKTVTRSPTQCLTQSLTQTLTQTLKRRVAKSLAISLASLTLLASPAIADHTAAGRSVETKKLCYCGCDHAMGAPMCAHLCELPKYQDRWWATSCRKPQPDAGKTAAPSPRTRTRSKQNKRPEQALLK